MKYISTILLSAIIAINFGLCEEIKDESKIVSNSVLKLYKSVKVDLARKFRTRAEKWATNDIMRRKLIESVKTLIVKVQNGKNLNVSGVKIKFHSNNLYFITDDYEKNIFAVSR